MLPEGVAGFLESHRDEHLAELCALLRFPSVANTEPEQCRRCADWLAGRLEARGLAARVLEGQGPPNVLGESPQEPGRPTLLIYGHYDVQPPDPLGQWRSEPFEPVVRDDCLVARGASDDKGQLMTHLAALDAWREGAGGLPVNVKVFLEGEEEIGSPHMEAFLGEHAGKLSADAAVISDSEFFAPGLPSITYSLRGLAYVEVVFRGPSADIHSGVHGGAATNPLNALAALVAGLHDDAGRVTLDGYYDDVLPLGEDEREMWSALPFDERAYAASLGVDALGGGEGGYSALERRWARPTLDANGLVGGYTQAGSKTIIPAEATAKISMRLVPDQDPQAAIAAFRRFVGEHTPPGIRAEIRVNSTARPVLLRRDSSAMAAASAALDEAFGRAPAFIRCGASVPITEMIQRHLGLDAVLLGFGLPDDNIHSPNERFRLEQFRRGCAASAALMGNLGS